MRDGRGEEEDHQGNKRTCILVNLTKTAERLDIESDDTVIRRPADNPDVDGMRTRMINT